MTMKLSVPHVLATAVTVAILPGIFSGARIQSLTHWHVPDSDAACSTPTIPYEQRYVGFKHNKGTFARLRIGNGGAGQSGLVGALAQTFIDWSRDHGGIKEDYAVRPFFLGLCTRPLGFSRLTINGQFSRLIGCLETPPGRLPSLSSSSSHFKGRLSPYFHCYAC